ncbi:MAG TPA: pilus assembly protein [Vitreimonas sp.]|uniref:TadE/TadG family type IV pilus assembly protein n=1 Tax=Vitreimonas sp. TaxID=3069702 RepID=UPI002D61C3E5|nr:pilus assembly protein [Vitreimonas sp.]HYD88147.1 pilus assembly protein [Vitreimonas sp.]
MGSGKLRRRRSAKQMLTDRTGNVAMMWALMGAVLVGLIGITVDFTRAQAIRSQMQNAIDGAALVAERSSNLTMAQRTAAARAFFDGEMGDLAQNVHFDVVELEEGGHRVTARMPMPLSLARIINNQDWTLAASAEAQANASPPIEVALVLDNTGSMANDMQALRDAASDLADDLLRLDGDTVRVALVPFVAQVNIGNQQSHRAWMDEAGTAPLNGEILEDRMIGFRDRNTTGNETSNHLFTGSNCEALSNLPYFDNPNTGGSEAYTGPYRVTWSRDGSRCYAFTPSDGVNHFTLFDLISNVDWKGCVEARPEPYDISDAAPNPATPATMFVPYFWMDTGGTAGQGSSNNTTQPNYRNNNQSYLSDTPGDLRSATRAIVQNANGAPPSTQTVIVTMSSNDGTSHQARREARFFNVFKYRGGSASVDDSAPDTRGPNRGCPTPIVPLTSNDATIQSNIAAMQHWMGGGTNQAEGLAWGWRVLSPTAPFTEGAPYGPDVRKVIVLMSDGENTNVGTDAVMEGDYSAYNYMGFWRNHASGNLITQLLFGVLHGVLPSQFRRNINSSNSYVTYVNNRQAQLCTNIKNAGIEIYTVIFRETDSATVNMMRACATSQEHFFRADSAAELSEAFSTIGTGIGSLRLTR